MILLGKKYLDANDYSKIIINKNNIKVYKDNEIEGNYKGISSEFKGLTNEEINGKVIEYFLDYNTIHAIDLAYFIGNKRYIAIEGDYRILLVNTEISKDSALNMIIKYNMDRYNELFDENIESYEIYTTLGGFHYDVYNNVARIYLCEMDEDLVDIERDLLEDLFNNLFIERPYLSDITYTEDTFPWDSYKDKEMAEFMFIYLNSFSSKVGGCRKNVIISEDMIKYVRKVMYEYTQRIDNNEMKLQMKMEGF